MQAHLSALGRPISHQQFVLQLRERARQLRGSDQELSRMLERAAEKAYQQGEPNCPVCRLQSARENSRVSVIAAGRR